MCMPLLVLLCSFQMVETEWTYAESEIYQPIKPNDVAVNQNGDVFILDSKECQIIKLDAEGNEVTRFGKKGQGPGEFQFPSQLQTFEDRVFLLDLIAKNLLSFDRSGKFIEQWKITGTPQAIIKTKSGFVFGEWSFGLGGAGSGGAVNAYDGALKNKTVWHDFSSGKEKEEQPDGFGLEIKDGKASVPFNPASDRPQLAGLPGGRFLALTHPGSHLKVDIYDATTGKVVQTVEENAAPLPFNKDWADRLLERRNKAADENPQQGSIKVHLQANYPEFFPYVRGFAGYGDGRFYLQSWTATPDKTSNIISFSEMGDIRKEEMSSAVFSRLLYLAENYALIGVFDSEEEQAGVVKVPRSELAAFVKANPITFSESAGFVIMAN